MRVITVSRVPLAGSVAQTALKYGTGGINIDACRIGYISESDKASAIPGGTPTARIGTLAGSVQDMNRQRTDFTPSEQKGRWPANLILIQGKNPEDCPVASLNEQSGWLHPSGNISDTGLGKRDSYEASSYHMAYAGRANQDHPDSGGGAARFFKQVLPMKDLKQVRQRQQIEGFKKAYSGDEPPKPIPQELKDYLLTLISSPDGAALYLGNLTDFNWDDLTTWADNSIFGIIVEGCPTEEQVAEFQRVLRPGAHLLLIAPDTQPTGHTGACRLEDGGFEIRDSILLIDEPGKFHYVAKTSRSEREAGCALLPGKTHKEWVCEYCKAGQEDPETPEECLQSEDGEHSWVEEETDGGGIRNHHPCVKPVKLMKRLLESLPVDEGIVIDPFMGSGSTLLAALDTGHDIIGIDQEEDYVKIADARVRYHDRSTLRKHETVIESDRPTVPEVQEMSMLEMLGLE